jgi:hypothetical protein
VGAFNLQGTAGTGPHTWTVYSTPNGSTGPFTLIGTYNTPTIALNNAGPCYYVKHEVSNGCGTGCATQSICESNCEISECILSTPTGLYFTHINGMMDQFNWNPVQYAAYYILEIFPNDPACCGGMVVSSTSFTYTVYGTSELVDYTGLLWPSPGGGGPMEGPGRCFSWRVTAVCSDGTTSNSSAIMCSGGSGGGDPWQRPAGAGSGIDDRQGNAETLQGVNGSNSGMSASLIYPNPASESVTLQLQNAGVDPLTIQIENGSGQVVKTVRGVKPESGFVSKSIRVDGLSKGTYVIRAYSKNKEVMSDRLVVE